MGFTGKMRQRLQDFFQGINVEVANVKSMKMLKSGVWKTIRICKNKIKKKAI